MKRIITSLALLLSFVFAAQPIEVGEKGCIESLENEIIKIVNSSTDNKREEKVIRALKERVLVDTHETCESGLENEIKKIVFSNKKTNPSSVIKKYAHKQKNTATNADYNAQDCIENFEAEVIKIINSNPNNTNKQKTKKIMHEIMHEKVVESCENEEKDTKKTVYSK